MSTFLQKKIVTILLTFQTFYVIIILEVKVMTIGDRIKKIRLDSGETQEVFAENLNLTKSTISIAESNKRNLSRRVLIDISNSFVFPIFSSSFVLWKTIAKNVGVSTCNKVIIWNIPTK